MFNARNPSTPGIGVGMPASFRPSTSSRFEAGSVLASSTRLPRSASAIAVAQASEVLPTPPLPVKNRKRVGASSNAASEEAFGVSFSDARRKKRSRGRTAQTTPSVEEPAVGKTALSA